MQNTLSSVVTISGIGLHTGRPVRIRILPASAEYGIWFKRTDIRSGDNLIAARWDNVTDTKLCTKISNHDGASVSTIEHVMAALAGCGVHNALVEIDGPEVPIFDGSASRFVACILKAGLRKLESDIRMIEVLKPVEVRDGEAFARFEPADDFKISFHIAFEDAAIGKQDRVLNMANGAFVRELSHSRTFCRLQDVDAMRKGGLALGGTFENAVVVDGDKVLSPGGLRSRDEPVRHKMLDALGDIALAGAPVMGHYIGHRAGHSLTNQLLRAVFADPTAIRMVTCDAKVALRLPGVGVSRADLPLIA